MITLDREKIRLTVYIIFILALVSFMTFDYELWSSEPEKTITKPRLAVASFLNIDPSNYKTDPYLANYIVLIGQLKKYHKGPDVDYLLLYCSKGTLSLENAELPTALKTVLDKLNIIPVQVLEEEGTPIWWSYHMNVKGHDGYKRAIGKIHLWTLDYYDKILFLDADIIINSEITDTLLSSSQGHDFAAVLDPHIGLISNVPYGAQNYFNAGLLVLKPSLKVYQNMMSFFGNSTLQLSNLMIWDNDYSDQDFLNFYFGASWYHLPEKYNLIHISQWPKEVLESSIVYHDKIWTPQVLEILPHPIKEEYIRDYATALGMLES